MAGYTSGALLWRHISCDRYLQNITIPLLAFTAKDDSITRYKIYPTTELKRNKNVVVATSELGGHCEFYYSKPGLGYRRYAPLVILSYLNEVAKFL
jgi:predicted alpha/beta-fold hydrolase